MELELNFKYAGIDWLVTVDVNDEWGLEQVFKVQSMDKKTNKLVDIPCDLQEFEKDMQDYLYDEIECEKQAAKDFWADMAYETAREEGRL